MPNEFDPLHQATRAVAGYLGKLERQLLEWDRNFTAHLNKLRGQKAKDIAELEENFKVFESGLPRLVKMEQAAKADKTPEQADKLNYENVFKRYREAWEQIFIPYARTLIKSLPKFKDLTEMNNVITGVRTQINALKTANTAKDGNSMKKIKIKFKDASWAVLNSNMAKSDDSKVTVTIQPGYIVTSHLSPKLDGALREKGEAFEETYNSLDEARASIKKRYRIYRERGTTFWVISDEGAAKATDSEPVLKFEPKISGTRVEYVGEQPKISVESEMVFWKDAPELVRKTYWWFIPHTNMTALRVSEGVFDLKIDYGSNRGERLSNVELFSKFTDNMFVKISGDDQMTFWVRENDPQAWAELVEYFGSEEKVLNAYIRWYH